MNRTLAWPVLAAVLAGAVLRLFELGTHSLWLDELFTIRAATREDWAGTFDELAQDVHPPLYFGAMRLWGLVAGTSDGLWRLPSALAGIATIGATAVLGLRTAGPGVGVLAAWLIALSPMAIDLEREARGNAWLLLFATVAAALAAGAGRGRPRVALAFGLACGLAVWTHVFGAFAVLAVLAWVALDDSLAPAVRRRWLLSGVAGGGSLILWAPTLARQIGAFSDHPWYVEPSGDSLSWLWIELASGQVGPAVVLLLCLLAGLVRGSPRAAALLLCGVLALVLLPQVLSYLVVPILRPRNVVPLLPMVCVVAAGGLVSLPHPRVTALAGGVLATMLALASVRTIHVEPGVEQWRDAASLVLAEHADGEPVIANHPNLWRYYLPDDLPLVDLHAPPPDAAGRAWLLIGHGDDDTIRDALLARATATELEPLRGVWAYRLDALGRTLTADDFPELPEGQRSPEGVHFYEVGEATSRELRLFGSCQVGLAGRSDMAAGEAARVHGRVMVGDQEEAAVQAVLADPEAWTWSPSFDTTGRPVVLTVRFLNDASQVTDEGAVEDRNAHLTGIRLRCAG